MSSTPTVARPPRLDLFARFQTATPLLIVYLALAALYAWQASRHPVPTIFRQDRLQAPGSTVARPRGGGHPPSVSNDEDRDRAEATIERHLRDQDGVVSRDRIVDLMRHLRGSEARRHVREEVPFYTGRRKDVAELVAGLA